MNLRLSSPELMMKSLYWGFFVKKSSSSLVINDGIRGLGAGRVGPVRRDIVFDIIGVKTDFLVCRDMIFKSKRMSH